MADIVTLSEVRDLLGTDATNTLDDPQITALIPAASLAIRNFTERDFGAPTVTEVRNFQYDGSGYLDINDASLISAVEFVVPNAANISVPSDLWTALPYAGPIFYCIQINDVYSGVNPAMGFNRNLDVLYREGRLSAQTTVVAVTATWGWPVVPVDVKLAAAWTIKNWMESASSDNLTAESIEGFSRSWARGGSGSVVPLAIPSRARDILAQYQRPEV